MCIRDSGWTNTFQHGVDGVGDDDVAELLRLVQSVPYSAIESLAVVDVFHAFGSVDTCTTSHMSRNEERMFGRLGVDVNGVHTSWTALSCNTAPRVTPAMRTWSSVTC